jgi:hypothetical protein
MKELQVTFLPLLLSSTATITLENHEPYAHTQNALLGMKLGAQKYTKARQSEREGTLVVFHYLEQPNRPNANFFINHFCFPLHTGTRISKLKRMVAMLSL